jgi:hypothetical protein
MDTELHVILSIILNVKVFYVLSGIFKHIIARDRQHYWWCRYFRQNL